MMMKKSNQNPCRPIQMYVDNDDYPLLSFVVVVLAVYIYGEWFRQNKLIRPISFHTI